MAKLKELYVENIELKTLCAEEGRKVEILIEA
jgi:hypothetical protein